MPQTNRRRRSAAFTYAALAAALVFTGLGPAGAGAQSEGGPPAEYRSLIRQAVGEYSEGRYAEARALFMRANATYPNARAQRGVGMASFELRHYADAVRSLEAALSDEREALDDRQRAQTEELLSRARAFVGRYRFEPPIETNVEVLVGSQAADLGEDGELILDIGEHRVLAGCVGCATLETVLDVRGGEEQTLTLEEEIPQPIDQVDARPVAEPAPDDLPSDSLTATWAFVGGGASVVGMGLAAAWWRDRNDEIALCEAAGALCHNQDTLEKERNAAMATTLLLAASTAAFFTWGFLELAGDDDDPGVSMRCGVGIGSVECRGSF